MLIKRSIFNSTLGVRTQQSMYPESVRRRWFKKTHGIIYIEKHGGGRLSRMFSDSLIYVGIIYEKRVIFTGIWF